MSQAIQRQCREGWGFTPSHLKAGWYGQLERVCFFVFGVDVAKMPCIIMGDHKMPKPIFNVPFCKEEWSICRACCSNSVDSAWEYMSHLFHRFLGGQWDGFHVDARNFFVIDS